MIEEQVGEFEKRDIQDQVDRILRDLGTPEPPIKLADVRTLLSLDLQYYSSTDPGLIAELSHRFALLARKTIPDFGKHLITALAKSRLCAFWVPDAARIMVDTEVPKRKHRWIEAHEISHSITPWHKHFLLGDNRQTLDPACHAVIEAEANYGAGRLLFLQDRFAAEARDLSLSFDSVKHLAGRYHNSILSTFWRTIEDRDPSQPVFGLVSVHPYHPDVGAHDGAEPWRYFVRSPMFRTQFSTMLPEQAYALVSKHATLRRTGPIFSATDVLTDVLGEEWEFEIESFSTKHALLTFGFPIRRRAAVVPL